MLGVPLTVGVGLTITETVKDEDGQLFAEAEIVKVVVCWVFVELITVPVIGFVVPDVAIPVIFVVFVLVQLNVVPATLLGLAITILVIAMPEQIVCVEGDALTVGVGFISTVTDVVDVHEPAVAVIVKVVVCGVLVELTKVPEIGFEVPEAAIPVRLAMLVLVQLNVVPATLFGFVIVMLEIGSPEQ